MNPVRYGFAPSHWMIEAHPTHCQPGIFVPGNRLQAAGQQREKPRRRGEPERLQAVRSRAEKVVGPDANHGYGQVDRHLVVTGQPGAAEKHSTERRTPIRLMSPQRTKEIEKHQWRNQEAAQDLGPQGRADYAVKRISESAEDGREARDFQFAAKRVCSECRQKVKKYEIPIQGIEGDLVGGVGWQKEQRPGQRKRRAHNLSQKRLAAPQVGIPQRKASDAPTGLLELQSRNIHLYDICVVDPGVLVGEHQLPAESATDRKHQKWTGPARSGEPCKRPRASTGGCEGVPRGTVQFRREGRHLQEL